MDKNDEGVTRPLQIRSGWVNGGSFKDSYFTEKHKLLMLKRNLEQNTFHSGAKSTIKQRKK
jgi:hypothetical protein